MKTQTWTAEYKLPGQKGRICKTTGTRDLEEAKEIATDEFYDMVAALGRGWRLLAPSPAILRHRPEPPPSGTVGRKFLPEAEDGGSGSRNASPWPFHAVAAP